MKTILALSILFSAIALPALGELTNADLNQIRLIVKDEVKSEIGASETRMKSYVDAKIDSLKTPVTWLIGLLVAIIAIIGLSNSDNLFRLAEHKGQHTRETD